MAHIVPLLVFNGRFLDACLGRLRGASPVSKILGVLRSIFLWSSCC